MGKSGNKSSKGIHAKETNTNSEVKPGTQKKTASAENEKKRPAAAAEQATDKPPTTKKAKGNEIDDIFSQAKPTLKSDASAKKEDTKAEQSKPVMGSKDDLFGAETGKGRKKTEEGFAIYTEDELGLGRKGGGDTDLCPFDCDCCF